MLKNKITDKSHTEFLLKSLKDRVKDNKPDEIREILEKLDTKLSGHRDWLYYDGDGTVANAMRDAIILGHMDILKLLLDAGASPNDYVRDEEHKNRRFPLIHFAVETGNLNIVKILVENGAHIHCTSIKGSEESNNNFGLREAVKGGHTDIVEYLLERGAITKQYLTKSGYKKLYEDVICLVNADKNKNLRIVESLLRHEADINLAFRRARRKLKDDGYQKYDIMLKSGYKKSDPNDINEHKQKKLELENKRDQLKITYASTISTLLDYAMGCDFADLTFLIGIDVSNFNFIGASLNGIPITKEILAKYGILGAKDAIVSLYDLMAITDEVRLDILAMRLEEYYQKYGKLVDENGIVNLIPLSKAVELGDIEAVKARLNAGIDPNTEDHSLLPVAVQNDDINIVKILTESHDYHTAIKAKHLMELAAEKVIGRTGEQCICVQNGYLQYVPLPFSLKSCLPIVTHKNYPGIISTFNVFTYTNINDGLTRIMNTATEIGKHVVAILKTDGNFKTFYYDRNDDYNLVKTKIEKFIEKTNISSFQHFFPIIFVDLNNMSFVDTLIESQYQQIDKAKKSFIDGIAIAKENDYVEIVEYLESHIDINQRDSDGNNQLHHAVYQCSLKQVKELITRGADINIKNNNGETPIDIAISYCSLAEEDLPLYFEIFEFLLNQGAIIELSTLSKAIEVENIEIIKLLLPVVNKNDIVIIYDDPCIFNKPMKINEAWYVNPMYVAIWRENCMEILRLLKAHGANFNEIGNHNCSLLSTVLYSLPSFIHKSDKIDISEKISLLNFLLDNGANPNVRDHGNTPLYILLKEKDLSFLEPLYIQLLDIFLLNGTDINALCENCSTPLHIASITGNTIAVDYLIKHGANLNAKDSDGNTPLHYAVSKQFSTVSKSLIEAGADLTILNDQSLTAEALLDHSFENQKSELQLKRSKIHTSYSPYNFLNDSIKSSTCLKAIYHEEVTLHEDYRVIKSAFSARWLEQTISP